MQWVTGLQFYYVIADPKVGERWTTIQRKYCKCNSFQVTTDLLNDNTDSSYCSALQWGTGLQFYYVTADPTVGEQSI